mmetsp:Transcript_145057/g.404098  ORF Transcript_145057/g.404098 Transcript_145057/m.404098 type:complete len:257 (+) Transcript_145057:1752-2522(+)
MSPPVACMAGRKTRAPPAGSRDALSNMSPPELTVMELPRFCSASSTGSSCKAFCNRTLASWGAPKTLVNSSSQAVAGKVARPWITCSCTWYCPQAPDRSCGRASPWPQRRHSWAAAFSSSMHCGLARASEEATPPCSSNCRTFRAVLPVCVRGNCCTGSKCSGTACPPSLCSTSCRARSTKLERTCSVPGCSAVSGVSASTTQATGVRPLTKSGPPTTAQALMAPRAATQMAASISSVPTRFPLTLMTSSVRPCSV